MFLVFIIGLVILLHFFVNVLSFFIFLYRNIKILFLKKILFSFNVLKISGLRILVYVLTSDF